MIATFKDRDLHGRRGPVRLEATMIELLAMHLRGICESIDARSVPREYGTADAASTLRSVSFLTIPAQPIA
ncbi:hypothetical protein BN2476_630105 [Paraburkholderia piptadeniae]|uniref:Uncharacterized protein n=1 Tax=Paraburkholderia piptadeniae TaxID=1701573 RepID=A0A1N7SLQ8_9BURK|nr:hypothetical protein BN2476_630105 [Paraburkholderia piptadeniae]